MVDKKIKRTTLKFVEALIRKGIRVEKVIIYGSHASGKTHPDSDIDVAIISSDFGRNKFEERKMLFQTAWRIDPKIEPIAISKNSYENDTWIPLIYEIKEKGIEFKTLHLNR